MKQPYKKNMLARARVWFPLLVILVLCLLCACAKPIPAVTPPNNSSGQTGTNTPTSQPVTNPPSPEQSKAQVKVEVLYFHRLQRCVTCLCFEERIRYVVKTYFQNDLDSGRLTFRIVNMGDKLNVPLINKYNAVGTQLFIHMKTSGFEQVKDIQEIWNWNCRNDKAGFDAKVKDVIERSLKGEL